MGRPPLIPILGVPYDAESWRLDAACRGTFDLMFDTASQDAATSLCDLCPVFDECDLYAVGFRPPAGIWAGQDSRKRERTRKKLQRRATR